MPARYVNKKPCGGPSWPRMGGEASPACSPRVISDSDRSGMMKNPMMKITPILLLLFPALLGAQSYDIVFRGGRVMDPESGLDGIRYVGIQGKKIAAISTRPLRGKVEIDANGMVIAPGFIDLHQHSHNAEAYRHKAMDGVTTAL